MNTKNTVVSIENVLVFVSLVHRGKIQCKHRCLPPALCWKTENMRKPPIAASCRTDAEQRLWKCHYTTRAAHRAQSTEQWERVLGWLGHWEHRWPPCITREEMTKPWKESFIMIRSITFPPTLPYPVSFFKKLFSLSNRRVVSVQSGKQILWAIVYGKRSGPVNEMLLL